MDHYLYKPTSPVKEYYLSVSPLHHLYVAHYGVLSKPVVIFLHGGPGAASEPLCARFFNPRHYHIILFDQRGCGRSRPAGELEENTTCNLIEDIERIRLHNNLSKIILFGGSWGASLSLLYAIKYPQNVRYYIIRGLCLMNSPDDEVFTPSLKLMYPEIWDRYTSLSRYQNPLLRAKEYFREIQKKNQKFINAWYDVEFKTLTPDPNDNHIKFSPSEKYLVSLLESYYYSNKFFLPSNYIIKHTDAIKDIPGIIIHGRLDVICSPRDSYTISQKLPKAQLEMVESAGHSYYDPLITKAMVNAVKKLSSLYLKK